MTDKETKEIQCRTFDFRCNYYYCNPNELVDFFKKWADKWCFKGEIGEGETQYKHWQCRFRLYKKSCKHTIFKQIMSFIERCNTIEGAQHKKDGKIGFYLEKTVKANHDNGTFNYIEKEQTSLTDVYKDSDNNSFVPDQLLEIEKLFDWQETARTLINTTTNRRNVNVLIDLKGEIGKSIFTTYMCFYDKCHLVPYNTEPKYNMYNVCNKMKDMNEHRPKAFFFDFPRAANKAVQTEFYVTMEEILKGLLHDPRVHYKEWWISTPHIWVFCNEAPDLSVFSKDRWKLWSVNDDQKLVPYKAPNEHTLKGTLFKKKPSTKP